MSMKGRDRHLKRLLKLQTGAKVAARRVLFVGADMVKKEAQHSLTVGAVSGKNHVPSAPGQPPNNDSGHLHRQIETAMPEELKATVTSNASYASDLEFGNSRIAARPYMRPARDKEKPRIRKLFAEEIDKLIKGS